MQSRHKLTKYINMLSVYVVFKINIKIKQSTMTAFVITQPNMTQSLDVRHVKTVI